MVRRAGLVFIGISILAFASICVNASDTVLIDSPSKSALTASVYTWQQTTTGDWQAPSSWTPARMRPSSSDVLVFSTGGTTTATNLPTQTIGQLIISGSTTVNLQSVMAIVLTVAGGDGDDLLVAPNSALNFNGASPITANIVSGATASINGSMAFSSSGAAVAHRLAAVDAGAITFNSGSVFTAGTGFAGNPFGATSLNSVIFAGGSTYVCIGGDDPFGAAEPASVVVFREGSLFSIQGNVTPSFSGRTYANFELNYPGGVFSATGSSALIMEDLNLIAGELDFRVTGNPGLSIRGNIAIAEGARLNFESGTIRLNGTTTQIISGSGHQGTSVSTVVIDNPMGVVANRPFVTYNLHLINGVVTTVGMVVVGVAGVVTRTNGYVNGYMQRIFQAPGTFAFDLGTENGYSPMTVEQRSGTFPVAVTAKAVQTAQPNIFDPSKALSRYWEVYAGNMSVDLTFQYLDADIPPTATEANFVIERYRNGFMQPDFGVVDTTTNTFRVMGFGDFGGDWTLAEPAAIGTPMPSPTGTLTPTGSPTPSISGSVTYGNAVGLPSPRFVSNVRVSGAGASNIFSTTIFPNGNYSLTDFQTGPYTVTPTKTDGHNGITSFDAALIARHVAGVSLLTGNALTVADTSDNGVVSSFDAGLIAKYVVGICPCGVTGVWRFFTVPNVPLPIGSTLQSRTYASVTSNLTGEDYTALLWGEASGNWTNTGARSGGGGAVEDSLAADRKSGAFPQIERRSREMEGNSGPERAVAVRAEHLVTQAGSEVVVPVRVQGVDEKGIISYEFDLRYDPSVIEPGTNPVDLGGTVSSKLSVVSNSEEPGLLRVAVYGAWPIDANGVLLNLRFTAIGTPGSMSPLVWERFMLNEGLPMILADGQVEVSAAE